MIDENSGGNFRIVGEKVDFASLLALVEFYKKVSARMQIGRSAIGILTCYDWHNNQFNFVSFSHLTWKSINVMLIVRQLTPDETKFTCYFKFIHSFEYLLFPE